MATALLDELLDIKQTQENLASAATEEHASVLAALAPGLLKSIREGTLTLEEIDSFLQRVPQVPSDLKQYLTSQKAWLLLRQGQGEQALGQYDEALNINPDSAVTWIRKGAALLELERVDEAFQAFQKAYLLRDNFGKQKEGYLRDLFQGWSTVSVFLGLEGILQQDLRKAQRGAEEYLAVLEKARGENLVEAVVTRLEAANSESEELRDAMEELQLMVRLLSIKDPFEGWRALTKEISKVWPADVSAVDAIREQRDREWNT